MSNQTDALEHELARVTAEKEQADDRIEGLKAALSRANDGMEQVASIVDPIVSNPGGELHTVELVAKLAKSFAALEGAEKAARSQLTVALNDIHSLRAEKAALERERDALFSASLMKGQRIEQLTDERDALDTQLKEAREQRDEARALLDGIVSQFASLKGGDATCATKQPDASATQMPSGMTDSGTALPAVASTGASEVPSSLSAEPTKFPHDSPWVVADLKHKLTEALAQIERLRGALIGPYNYGDDRLFAVSYVLALARTIRNNNEASAILAADDPDAFWEGIAICENMAMEARAALNSPAAESSADQS